MDKTAEHHVVVAGAGIGGLTAALCLHGAGYRVTVLEQVREIAPLGVGINVQPPAIEVLTGLGFGDRLAERGVATSENVYLDHRGTRLFAEPRGRRGGHQWPQYAVHRGELQTMLLDHVRAVCGPDSVRTGSRVTDVDEGDDAVRVTVTGRDTGERRTLRAGILVGADGLHSAVRAILHPDDGPFLYSGTVMYRGVTAAPGISDGRSMLLAQDPAGVLFLAYPIHHPGYGSRTVANWVCLAPSGEPGPVRAGEVGWNRTGTAADVLEHLRGWDLGVLDAAGLVTGAESILVLPMVDREPLARWGTGRVTLLGDAAHPMYPVGANGATQAILDARALADALVASGDAAGLARYERERRPATSEIVRANREMHRAEHTGPEAIRSITDRYRTALRGGV